MTRLGDTDDPSMQNDVVLNEIDRIVHQTQAHAKHHNRCQPWNKQ